MARMPMSGKDSEMKDVNGRTIEENTVKKAVSATRGFYATNGNLPERHHWETHAVSEFGRMSERYGLDFDSVKCGGVQIVGNFTVVHYVIELDGSFSVRVYGCSKRRMGDNPSIECAISVAASKAVKAITGRIKPYTAVSEEELETEKQKCWRK